MSDFQIQQGDTTHPVKMLLISSTDHISPAIGVNVTTLLAATKIGKSTGVLTAAAGSWFESGNGEYLYTPTSSETNTLGEWSVSQTGVSGVDPSNATRQIVPWNPYAAANTVGGPASAVVANGTAQAGAASSITLAVSGSSTTTDFYKGDYVLIVGGTGQYQARTITAYNGVTLVATVSRSWAVNPDSTSVYAVIANPNPALDANLAVVVGSYSAGEDPASLVLASPGNKLVTNVSGQVDIDLAQAVPNTPTQGTIGDALLAAEADGVGKWTLVGTTLTLYRHDGVTVVRAFTLDSATAPTTRT